jgi:nucleoside-diphosphate-sugar epimerase
MRILVAGGSGFLGGYALAEAARRGHEVMALTRSDTAARRVTGLGARPVRGDLDQHAGLGTVFADAGCDVLVSLASLGFGHGPPIVAAAEKAGIRRAVFVSTTAVTTALNPPSKQVRLAAERSIRTSALDWTILRPTMIYGAPGDRNLSRLLTLLSRTRGLPVLPVPGAGRRLHQPVHVADAASAVLAAAERPAAAGSSYDIAGPEPLPFAELLRICARAVGSRARFAPVPLPALVAGARVYERLSRQPKLRAEQLLRLAEDKAFGIDDARSDLGYRPRLFDDGIGELARAMGLAA